MPQRKFVQPPPGTPFPKLNVLYFPFRARTPFRSYDRNQALEKHGEDSSPDSLPGDFAVPTERDASVEAW